MPTFIHRLATLLVVALALSACGASTGTSSAEPTTTVVSDTAEPSEATVESAQPSEVAGDPAGPCLDADILAALEAYKDGEVPADPSMEEVADAMEALELDGRAAEFRDGVVEALRGETGETLDTMKIHDAMFSLIPLESEIQLVAC